MSALADVRGGRLPVGIRWLARIAAVISLMTLTGCVILLMSLHSTPLPPLLNHLSQHGGSQDFAERLDRRFPVGSPEADLMRELWLEDFRPTTSLRSGLREAEFDTLGRGNFDICRTSATVMWSADDQGRLISVNGRAGWICL